MLKLKDLGHLGTVEPVRIPRTRTAGKGGTQRYAHRKCGPKRDKRPTGLDCTQGLHGLAVVDGRQRH
eukprot:3116171-Pyramimonas_sp.AAC.1